MTNSQIIAMQEKLKAKGFYDGEIDGHWGAISNAACQRYLRSLMPSPHPWPKTDQASLTAFYGEPGDESKLVAFEFPYPTFYEGRRVTKGRCHRKVAESLVKVLTAIGDRWAGKGEVMEPASDYGGIYNNRAMRGGTTPSLHARGAAIDLDADDNGNRVHWPVAADMPLEIMEEFAKEGWMSAGAFWNRDAMHFQATQ